MPSKTVKTIRLRPSHKADHLPEASTAHGYSTPEKKTVPRNYSPSKKPINSSSAFDSIMITPFML